MIDYNIIFRIPRALTLAFYYALNFDARLREKGCLDKHVMRYREFNADIL